MPPVLLPPWLISRVRLVAAVYRSEANVLVHFELTLLFLTLDWRAESGANSAESFWIMIVLDLLAEGRTLTFYVSKVSRRFALISNPSLIVFCCGVRSESRADLLLSTRRSKSSVFGAADSSVEPIWICPASRFFLKSCFYRWLSSRFFIWDRLEKVISLLLARWWTCALDGRLLIWSTTCWKLPGNPWTFLGS